jgi:DNA-damage-inducible protein J
MYQKRKLQNGCNDASLENDELHFIVKHRAPKPDLLEAIEDTRLRRNLTGPFKTAEEALASMLHDDNA